MSERRVTYREAADRRNTEMLREVLSALPSFVKDYFRAMDARTTTKTKLSYAYDFRVFFEFLKAMNPLYKNHELRDFTLADLDQVTARDLEEYMEYLKLYDAPADRVQGEARITNSVVGQKRKISALRSLYNYLYKQQMVQNNPTQLIEMPKVREKAIIRLDREEVDLLLEYIENCGASLSGKALEAYRLTRERDIALVTLLLGTGIRVSECVGLDIEDLDLRNDRFRVVRKGGNEAMVYFGDEVREALLKYLTVREGITPLAGHEHALFYSTQRRRITVRAVENLVQKYAGAVTTAKHITPHKLRSTYGTALYQETGDIYLVADVLGHKDVNTTRKHYAAMDETRRKSAADAVRLRKEHD